MEKMLIGKLEAISHKRLRYIWQDNINIVFFNRMLNALISQSLGQGSFVENAYPFADRSMHVY